MKTKIFEFTIKKKCSDFVKGSDQIIEKLIPLGLKIRADKDSDIVNGYLSMVHTSNNHLVIIGIYEENENPNYEHLTVLKKPGKIPTEKEIKDLLV